MVDEGVLDTRNLRVIRRSGRIPTGPIADRADPPAPFKDDMRRFLPALPVAHPAIHEAMERGGGAGFRAVTHADDAPVVRPRRG